MEKLEYYCDCHKNILRKEELFRLHIPTGKYQTGAFASEEIYKVIDICPKTVRRILDNFISKMRDVEQRYMVEQLGLRK